MQLLDNALEIIKPYIVEALESGIPVNRDLQHRSSEDYGYFRGWDLTATIARLRLDWELVDPLGQFLDADKIADGMIVQMRKDLLELIEDGDVTKSSDPLLNSMDGSKKRGKEPVNVDIFNAQLFWEHSYKRETTQYMLYLLMAVQWED